MIKYFTRTAGALILTCLMNMAYCQEPVKADTLLKKLDSLKVRADTVKQINDISEDAYNENTRLNGRSYLILLGSNIKQEFTKPFHMKRSDFGKLGLYAASVVALGFADEPIQKAALDLRNRNSGVRSTGKFISNFGFQYEIYTLAAFGAYGMIFKNVKVKTVTLLATQSVITGLLMESVVKTITGRTRPNYYGPLEEAEPSFKGPFANLSRTSGGKKSNSSFPSGHTTAAFAAATVFAVEYKHQPLIPIIAYSMATLVGVSRITENKHWATDVFTGAVLGYLTGRQVSFNYHRFAKIKNDESRKKNTVTMRLNYDYGQLMPGLVWKFN
ncbi:MAG: phosphatase PAP2 family protein [Chitinophagaceae bacterium]|nr:MAG: phosphatase PAP2 family protein [Chitinophagaceae bacterium]